MSSLICHVCGEKNFCYREVLWPQLIIDWQLAPAEADYINRQQGYCCVACGNNLRSIALALAILSSYAYRGPLNHFVETPAAQNLHVLEINEAGGLTSTIKKLAGHQLINYPQHDMTNLSFEKNTFDLVIHSDTLEHISNPIAGLAECRRVLKESGRCIFTIPIITGRLTRSRAGLSGSFHGAANEAGTDLVVQTEFGADMWKFVFEAGFKSATIHCLEYPAALAIEAKA